MGFKVALVGGVPNGEVPGWVTERLEQAGIEFVARNCVSREQLAEIASDADVVWTLGNHECLYAENLDVLSRCVVILRTGSGTDNIPVREATDLGIIVANTPQAISDSVSNHAIGLLFAVIRQIVIQDKAVRGGVWDRYVAWPNWHLHDQTFGLVGFGNIAQLVARKLSGFSLKMIAYDPYIPADFMAERGVRAVSLEELLTTSDFISLHCPLIDSTHHLINERTLRMMKPQAVLINTGRGPLIDEVALLRALKEGWIAAAGLDVFEQEPTPHDNPLLKLDNVVATPHIAGYSDEFWGNFWLFSVDTVIDIANGRMPRSYVNRDVKPRRELGSRENG